jgi:hypothetical protein
LIWCGLENKLENRWGECPHEPKIKWWPQAPAREDARPTKFEFVQMKLSREGREGGEGFFMDKNFDRSKINL